MQITIERKTLLDAVRLVAKATGKRECKDAFKRIHLITSEVNTGVDLVASNGTTTIRTRIDANAAVFGHCSVDAKELLTALRSTVGKTLIVETVESCLTILHDGGHLILSAKDYDHLPVPNVQDDPRSWSVTTNAKMLSRHFACGADLATDEEIRYATNGVFFNTLNWAAEIVATDCKRLYRANVKHLKEGGAPTSFIAPKVAAELLGAMRVYEPHCDLAEVVCGKPESSDGPRVVVYIGKTIIWFRPVEGRFPPYAEVFPKKTPNVYRANRKELLTAAKALGKTARVVHFSFDGRGMLKLEGLAGDERAIVSSASCKVIGSETDCFVNLDREYIMEALTAVSDDIVTVAVTNEDRPVVVLAEHATQLLMPLA